MKIYDKNNLEIYDISVDDSSVRYRAIMTDDSLTLNFAHTAAVTIPRLSYVNFEGQRYTLWRPSEFKKLSTRNFEYTLVLHGWREYLKFVKYKDMSAKPYQLKFSLTGKPIVFLQNLVATLNHHDAAGGWVAGDCIDAPEKTLSFNHEFCIDAIGRFAQEWQTEFEFEGKKIHLRKVEKFKSDPLPLSYGKGNGFLPGVGRYNEGDKQPIGRLFVQGGERNIDFSTYGGKQLLLPKSQTLMVDGKTYRTDADGMFITRDGNTNTAEDSYDASEIYPKRVGTVSEVVVVDSEKHFYDIKDSSIPEALNYRDCRIAGEKATVKFESGALAGREFDIEQTDTDLTGYIHAERRFKIIPAELDGQIMPGGVFIPAVGDKYAIFNISMPTAYISDNATKTGASWDMFREAVRYFAENENDRFRFSGELDSVWSKSRWLEIGGKIVPGGHVLFSDDQFQPTGVVIRIVAVKDYVNKPHKPEITLSNAPISGSFSSGLAKLEADEVIIEESKKEIIRLTKRQWRDIRETMEMLNASLLNFSGSINPITVQTMQLILGDESLQFRFVNSKTVPVRINHSITFNTANKTLSAAAGILQHMSIGITTLKNKHAASEYKYWDMAAYTSPVLDVSKSYYLYAKCSKTTNSGTFLLSETAIAMEGVTGFYHLLVGILNSENLGERSFASLYGYTEITPGRVVTNRIESEDGVTFFDLVNGIIGGKIRFIATGGTETNLADWADLTAQDIQGAQSSADAAQNSANNLKNFSDTAFADGVINRAERAAIEKYKNSVNETKLAVDSGYTQVYNNTYLEGTPKTNLLNAKTALNTAYDNLMSSINTAISDNIATPAEKADVDAKFALFNTALATYQVRLEEANKAIQTKLDNLSTKKVNDLQIGGRNYFTLLTNLTCWRTDNGSTLYPIERFIGGFAYNLINGVGSNIRISNNLFTGLWTMSFDLISSAANQIITIDFGDTNLKNFTTHETANTRKHITYTAENTGSFAFFDIALSATINDIRIENLKIEKYGKETDFSESPEDTASRINSAKQEALTAAGSAQTSANTAQTTANALKDFTDTSFSDGVVNRAEAKSIEKYINTLNEAMAKAEPSYNKVYANTYLEGTPKTNLLNAKISLWGKRDALLTAINTAISGGIATPAQKAAVDTAYTNFNTDMTAFQNALEEANKAVQTKLDAISKGYVDELAGGGANLVQALSAWTLGTGWQLISDTLVNTTSSTFNHCQSPNFNLVAGKRYILTAFVEDIVGSGAIQIHTGTIARLYVTAKKGDISVEFTAIATEAAHIRVYGNTTTIYKIKNIVVRAIGVQERIDISKSTAEQAQLAADGYMRARYVRDWQNGNALSNNTYWQEIKVFTKSGVNVAKNKAITSNATFNASYPITNIVDENSGTWGAAYNSSPTLHWVSIDLGQIYYDIESIIVWRMNLTTYYGTKTEISVDGVNWTPVFDSAKSGTYKETAEGNIISLRPHEVLAKTLKSQAITDKFGVTINGGLIGAVTMLLRELNSTDETAGISGIRGANKNLPAFWTGTYADAIAGTAGIIFRHNSTGKIGVLDVDANGNVKLLDAADPNLIRLIFSKSQIPLVADILSSTQFGQSVTNLSSTGSTTGSTTLANGLSVTKDGSELTFSGILSVYAILDFAHGYTSGYAEISISLFKNGSYYAVLSSVGGSLDASMDIINETYNLNSKLIVPSGNYTIVVQRTFYGVRNQTGGISNTSTFAWSFVKDIRRFEFGLDGFMSWYTNCHSHFTENGGYDGRAPYNKWNMPGVLAAGSSTSGGIQSNVWGAKSSTANITPITGGFRVPLSGLSHSNYVVQITPHTNTTFRVGTKTSTYFEVYGTGGFDYVVIGNNYA